MNSRYLISTTAEQDIEEAIMYIAQENKKTAHEFVDSLYAAFTMLAENPLIGHSREDITDHPVRFWTFKWHYMVIYMPTTPLKVVRVLSGQRNLSHLII